MKPFGAHFTAPIDAGEGLVLRSLTHGDMPAILAMFADSDVARWWTSEPEEIAELIDDEPTVWPYLVTLADDPIGYFQIYHANPEPFWAAFGVPAETFGLDMFLARHREQGHGSRMVRAAIERVLRLPQAVRVQIDPDPGNARAVRAYEKAGFVAQGVFPGYEAQAQMLYMTIDKIRGTP